MFQHKFIRRHCTTRAVDSKTGTDSDAHTKEHGNEKRNETKKNLSSFAMKTSPVNNVMWCDDDVDNRRSKLFNNMVHHYLVRCPVSISFNLSPAAATCIVSQIRRVQFFPAGLRQEKIDSIFVCDNNNGIAICFLYTVSAEHQSHCSLDKTDASWSWSWWWWWQDRAWCVHECICQSIAQCTVRCVSWSTSIGDACACV